MANILELLPEIQGEEMVFVQSLIKDMSDSQAAQFATVYRVRRKEPGTILLLACVGFIGIAGIQRFLLDQIGMGLLYFFTGGICLIGTIIDIVTYKRLAFEYNQVRAVEIAGTLRPAS
jgi:TM2 domain-containing membrane protein YozV